MKQGRKTTKREEMREWFPRTAPGKKAERWQTSSQDGVKEAPAGCVAFVEARATFKSK